MRSFSVAAGLLALSCATATLAQQKQAAFSLPTDERISFASSSSTSPPSTDFAGQQVVRFSTSSKDQHKALLGQAYSLGLDVWAAHLGKACLSTETVDVTEVPFGCVDVRLAIDTADEDPTRKNRASTSSMDLVRMLTEPLAVKPRATTLIDNLDVLISQQKQRGDVEEQMLRGNAWHKTYHTLSEIESYMHSLAEGYPGHVQVIELGKTHEGRSILGLKISNDLTPPPPQPPSPPQDPPTEPNPEPVPDPPSNATAHATLGGDGKLGIVITGGQHAREWISISSSLYFASEILRSALGAPHPPPSPSPPSPPPPPPFSAMKKKQRKGRKGRKKQPQPFTKKQAQLFLSTFTITIIPVSNPDGYVYSWDHNRMWRKNRQPNKFPSGVFCKGVDLNRNYGYAFSNSLAGNMAAFGPCSEMYGGHEAFSSAETRAIGEYLGNAENNVKGYFDLHSYGQLLMYPFSYSCEDTVPDEEDLLELSLGAISALKKIHGRGFNAGKVCQVYARGGGNSVDWSYASSDLVPPQGGDPGEGVGLKKKIKWSFSIELRDGGTYGFLLPKEQIVPASQEVSAALAYMLNFIAKKDAH